MEQFSNTFIYLIPIAFIFIAFLVTAISVYADYRKNKKEREDNSIHYVERIMGDKYITTCNRHLDLDCRNVTNFITKTTCVECLKKIT